MNRTRTRRTKLEHPESIDEHELSQVFVEGFKTNDIDASFQRLSAAFEITGFSLQSMTVEVDGDISHWDSELETKVVTNDGYNSLYLLEQQKLIQRLAVNWTREGNYDFCLGGLLVTPLGFDFYCRCAGRSNRAWVPDEHRDAKLRRPKTIRKK